MNRYLPHHLPPLLAVQLIPMDTLFALLVVLLVVFFAHSGGLAFMLNSPRGPSAREAACVPKVFSRLSGGNCNENLNVRINVRTSRCLALHDSLSGKGRLRRDGHLCRRAVELRVRRRSVHWNGARRGSLERQLQHEVLSDVISAIGPGTGPWTNHVGIFAPACLLGPTEGDASFNNSKCALGWSDAQGWSLQWDPGNYGDGILSSTAHDFFGMGEFVSVAATYSVNIPEPPTILPLGVALVLVWAWRSRNRVHHGQIV